MLTQLRNAGKISQADYDRQAITWTSASIDIFTKGLEVEVVANPTKSLTLRASYSQLRSAAGRISSPRSSSSSTRVSRNGAALLANQPHRTRRV